MPEDKLTINGRVRKLLHARKQAIIEADGTWNPYDEVITEEECDAIEQLCDSYDNEF